MRVKSLLRRGDCPKRIEQAGKSEVTPFVRHHRHLVDLGHIVHLIDGRRRDIGQILHHFPDPPPAVLAIDFVGVKDELWIGELFEVLAGGEKYRAPPLGAVFHHGQVLSAKLIVGEVAFVAAGNGRSVQQGPVETIGRGRQETGAGVDHRPAGEQALVATTRVGVCRVANDMCQALPFSRLRIVGNVVVPGAVPLVATKRRPLPDFAVGGGGVVDVVAKVPPFPDTLVRVPLGSAPALQGALAPRAVGADHGPALFGPVHGSSPPVVLGAGPRLQGGVVHEQLAMFMRFYELMVHRIGPVAVRTGCCCCCGSANRSEHRN